MLKNGISEEYDLNSLGRKRWWSNWGHSSWPLKCTDERPKGPNCILELFLFINKNICEHILISPSLVQREYTSYDDRARAVTIQNKIGEMLANIKSEELALERSLDDDGLD